VRVYLYGDVAVDGATAAWSAMDLTPLRRLARKRLKIALVDFRVVNSNKTIRQFKGVICKHMPFQPRQAGSPQGKEGKTVPRRSPGWKSPRPNRGSRVLRLRDRCGGTYDSCQGEAMRCLSAKYEGRLQ
jgi:hypothetical protein